MNDRERCDEYLQEYDRDFWFVNKPDGDLRVPEYKNPEIDDGDQEHWFCGYWFGYVKRYRVLNTRQLKEMVNYKRWEGGVGHVIFSLCLFDALADDDVEYLLHEFGGLGFHRSPVNGPEAPTQFPHRASNKASEVPRIKGRLGKPKNYCNPR
jgi:hypothetical protein